MKTLGDLMLFRLSLPADTQDLQQIMSKHTQPLRIVYWSLTASRAGRHSNAAHLVAAALRSLRAR